MFIEREITADWLLHWWRGEPVWYAELPYYVAPTLAETAASKAAPQEGPHRHLTG